MSPTLLAASGFIVCVCVGGCGLCLRVEDKGRLQCPAVLGHLSRGLEPCRWLVSPSNPPASVPHSAGVTLCTATKASSLAERDLRSDLNTCIVSVLTH